MGNRQVVVPSDAAVFLYQFEINARDHGFKKIEFDPVPFDEGKFRLAFKGKVFVEENMPEAQVANQNRALSCWRMNRKADRPFYPCVVSSSREVMPATLRSGIKISRFSRKPMRLRRSSTMMSKLH